MPVKAAKRRLPGVAVLILTVFGATQFIVVDRPVVDVVLKLPRNIIVGRVEKPDKPVNLVAPAGWRIERDSRPVDLRLRQFSRLLQSTTLPSLRTPSLSQLMLACHHSAGFAVIKKWHKSVFFLCSIG